MQGIPSKQDFHFLVYFISNLNKALGHGRSFTIDGKNGTVPQGLCVFFKRKILSELI